MLSSAEGAVSADAMRSTMLPLLKHTRLCTLSYAQLCEEVIPSNIVTFEEVQKICFSVAKRLKDDGLSTICNEVEPRKSTAVKALQIDVDRLCPPMVFAAGGHRSSKYEILAMKKLKLISFEFMPLNSDENGSYQRKITMKISKVTDHVNMTSSETPRMIEFFNGQISYGQPVEVPLRDDKGDLELVPLTRYILWIRFYGLNHPTWIDESNTSHLLVSNSDLILNAVRQENGGTRNQLKGFKYSTQFT